MPPTTRERVEYKEIIYWSVHTLTKKAVLVKLEITEKLDNVCE